LTAKALRIPVVLTTATATARMMTESPREILRKIPTAKKMATVVAIAIVIATAMATITAVAIVTEMATEK
jgi:hypothetical protein